MLDRLFPTNEIPTSAGAADGDDGDGEDACDPTPSVATKNEGLLKMPKELSEIEYMKSLYMKSTISALRILKEIRSKSSTVSVFSLPPLQISGLEETWNTIPVLE